MAACLMLAKMQRERERDGSGEGKGPETKIYPSMTHLQWSIASNEVFLPSFYHIPISCWFINWHTDQRIDDARIFMNFSHLSKPWGLVDQAFNMNCWETLKVQIIPCPFCEDLFTYTHSHLSSAFPGGEEWSFLLGKCGVAVHAQLSIAFAPCEGWPQLTTWWERASKNACEEFSRLG